MLALKAEARLQSEAGLEPHLAASWFSPEPDGLLLSTLARKYPLGMGRPGDKVSS